MAKFIVDIVLDGYNVEEEMVAACEKFLYDQLNITASSVEIKQIDEEDRQENLWLCGLNKIDPDNWEFIGVFSDEQKAIDACKDEDYFIAPIKLNECAPDETTEFPDAYYPKGE